MNEFIYTLKPVTRLQKPEAWTPQDNLIVEQHILELQKRKDSGVVVLAGRTQVSPKATFGIVIIYAESEADAQKIMKSDPAVQEGIMTAELFPFKTAFITETRETAGEEWV